VDFWFENHFSPEQRLSPSEEYPQIPAMNPSAYLRTHAAALRSATAACSVRRPKPSAVHDLRACTRRVLALVDTLPLLAALPNPVLLPARASKRFRRLAAPLSRAAGATRDLDVQLALLKSLARAHPDAPRLRTALRDRRKLAARALTRRLHRDSAAMLAALAALERSLAHAPIVPDSVLARLARSLFRAESVHLTARALRESEDALHDLRKAARPPRFLLESASTPRIRAAAKPFRALQQSIGQWHDAALLAAAARSRLKPASPLLARIQRDCARKHTAAKRLAAHSLPARTHSRK
jgi:CHAD domain-containing protein